MPWPPRGPEPPKEPPKKAKKPRLSLVPSVEGKHPNQYTPDSKTQKKLARRTRDGLRSGMKERRDKYIDGLLQGMTKYNAAIYAGVPKASAAKVACELWYEPYVRETFATLREKMDEEQLLSRKEWILNMKSLAFTDYIGPMTRVAAGVALAKVMGYEAPAKTETEFKGGVMLIPAPSSMSNWEKSAIEAQATLKLEAAK
jgi:hypothetical protein